MKTHNAARLSFILFVMLEACPNEGPYHFFTQVKSDGSCRRELIRSADSAFVMKGDTSHNPFPMKLDSTWHLSFYKKYEDDTMRFKDWPASKTYKDDDSGKSFSWFVTAEKVYPSVKEMSESFRFDDSGWRNLTPKITFKKRFRWFYTYFEFSETYPKSNPFTLVPISEYMSDKEVTALYGEDKELYRGKNGFEILGELKTLNDKSEEWLEHNFYEEIYKVYMDNYDRFKDAPVDLQDFAMEKDTIYKYYLKNDSSDFSDLDDVLNHHFQTNAYTTEDDFDSILEAKLGNVFWPDNIELNYHLSMPGKIIETNAPFLRKDTLAWKVDYNRFYFNDYILGATSRKPNYWAFAITVIVVLSALVAFLIRRRPS